MYQHHLDSIELMKKYFKEQSGVIALVLGGSVAKGEERPDSDLDAMVIVDDETYEMHKKNNNLSHCVYGECTYDGGYYDVKYFTKDYLRLAVQKGSEPTRNSFVSAKVLYSTDNEIEDLINNIQRYPIEKKQSNIELFYSILLLNKDYFYNCAIKDDDIYTLTKSCYEIVYGGMRMLYAYNEVLFPSHRKLMNYAERLAKKPENIIGLANKFLDKKDKESKDSFVDAIINFTNWNIEPDYSRYLSLYVEKTEQSWQNSDDNIHEI